MEEKKPIRSFKDLDVYQNTYKAMMEVMTKIIPVLPKCEEYDLKDQMRRACKAIPRLIAKAMPKGIKKQVFRNIWMMPCLKVMKWWSALNKPVTYTLRMLMCPYAMI